MKIALDVMGGDNAPQSNILGAKTFLDSNKNTSLILVGDKTIINDQLKEHNLSDHSKIDIHHTSEVITMNETMLLQFCQNHWHRSISNHNEN